MKGDFEAWRNSALRCHSPWKTWLGDKNLTRNWKLFGFMTCLMLIVSDGLWTWFLRLMLWSKLEELTVLILLYFIYTPIYIFLIHVDLLCFYQLYIYIYSIYKVCILSYIWPLFWLAIDSPQNLQVLRQERKLHDQRRVIAGALQVQLRRRAAAWQWWTAWLKIHL